MDRVTWTVDENDVAVITLNDGENRFNPPFLASFLDALDAVEEDTGAKALVVTSAHEKIFSNGIDLDWLAPLIQAGKTEEAQAFFEQMMALFRRILLYPMPTIAAATFLRIRTGTRATARAGRAAFFAPLARTRPTRGVGP